MSKILRPLFLTAAFAASLAFMGAGVIVMGIISPQMLYYLPPASFRFLASLPFLLFGLTINPLVWWAGRRLGVRKILIGGLTLTVAAGLFCANTGFGRYVMGDFLSVFVGDSKISRALIEGSAASGAPNGLYAVGVRRLMDGRSDAETIAMLRRAANAGEQRAMHMLMLYEAGVQIGKSRTAAPDLAAAQRYHCLLEAAPRHNALALEPGTDIDLPGQFGWTCPGDEPR